MWQRNSGGLESSKFISISSLSLCILYHINNDSVRHVTHVPINSHNDRRLRGVVRNINGSTEISFMRLNAHSHLPAFSNHHGQIRHIPALSSGSRLLNLLDDVHTYVLVNLAKDNMLAIKMRRWCGGDEELGSVGIRTTVLRFKLAMAQG